MKHKWDQDAFGSPLGEAVAVIHGRLGYRGEGPHYVYVLFTPEAFSIVHPPNHRAAASRYAAIRRHIEAV